MVAAHSPAARANTVLFALWALFWVAMIAVGFQDALRNPLVRWWEPLLWESSSAFVATLWFLLQRRADAAYAQYLDRPWLWFTHHAKWLLLLIPSFIVSTYLLRHGLYRLLGEEYRHEPWSFIIAYESVKLTLFVSLWLGIIFGFNSFAQWRSQREDLLAAQKALAESQLLQLQGQLRPHFLFNALNTISSLMHVDPMRADRLLARLGDLLRMSLVASNKELTTLREELRMLELYAQIMGERFTGRVTLAWNIDAAMLGAAVPTLLLQPLLENAFKHGVELAQDAALIRIEARQQNEALELVVANSSTTQVRPESTGIGLRNCRERLRLLYGECATLELAQEPTEVVVRVRLPYREYAP